MSETGPVPIPGVKSFMSVPKAEFGRNLFGSPMLHTLIKSAYFWGILIILVWAIILSPVFLLPLIALMISRSRYVITKRERDIEKHGDFIEKVSRSVFLASGIRLQPEQIIRLWMNRMVIADEWVFTVKGSDSGEEFEIVGSELSKR